MWLGIMLVYTFLQTKAQETLWKRRWNDCKSLRKGMFAVRLHLLDNVRKHTLMKSYQIWHSWSLTKYGCLNKTWKRTTSGGVLTRRGKSHQDPTLDKNYSQQGIRSTGENISPQKITFQLIVKYYAVRLEILKSYT